MRHFSASTSDDDANIDMSPLIDVVFILLIFFIVTTVFVNEAGVTVDKPPKMASQKALEKQSIIIAVTQDGQVYHGGKNIGVDGVAAVVSYLQEGGEALPCIIQGDAKAPHGIVTKVVDEATMAGVKSVHPVTKQ